MNKKNYKIFFWQKSTILDKIFVNFFTFKHNFFHHKWNGTRLLSLESEYDDMMTHDKRHDERHMMTLVPENREKSTIKHSIKKLFH